MYAHMRKVTIKLSVSLMQFQRVKYMTGLDSSVVVTKELITISPLLIYNVFISLFLYNGYLINFVDSPQLVLGLNLVDSEQAFHT